MFFWFLIQRAIKQRFKHIDICLSIWSMDPVLFLTERTSYFSSVLSVAADLRRSRTWRSTWSHTKFCPRRVNPGRRRAALTPATHALFVRSVLECNCKGRIGGEDISYSFMLFVRSVLKCKAVWGRPKLSISKVSFGIVLVHCGTGGA